MKYKMVVLILALTVMSWAQTATQASPSALQQSSVATDKAKCSCCDKMAAGDAKDTHACCAHHHMNAQDSKEMASGKDTMSCCSGKDAKSCIRKDNGKTGASCCKDNCGNDSCSKDKTAASCCGGSCGQDGKGCCSKQTEKTAKSCSKEELHS